MKSSWAVVLCKFTDNLAEPFTKQYYTDLFTADNTGSPWNMIRYFSDYSHGTLDLTGTQVFGWYQLNKSVSDYNSLGGAARDELIKWARAAAATNGVDLTPFFSIVVCTNHWHDIGASQSLSGVVAQGQMTPIPRLLAHEMGHVYGLEHSRIDDSPEDYKDPWDIMSAATVYSAPDEEFTLLGPGVNAWNMRSRGWLDESRVWKDDGNSFDETITLRPLQRHDLAGFLAAELPGGYLAEFRVREGWDAAIPRAAVLVHRFADNHSYLAHGNLGNSDLIAGDSFGDPVPTDLQFDLFSSFTRLDVVSIDINARTAELRIRHRRPSSLFGLAIDPMAMVLLGKAYLIWVEMHHPHVPQIADITAVLRSMSREERIAVMTRAKALNRYTKAVEEAIAKIDSPDHV